MNVTARRFTKQALSVAFLVGLFLTGGHQVLSQELLLVQTQESNASGESQKVESELHRVKTTQRQMQKAYEEALAIAEQSQAALLTMKATENQIDMDLVSDFWIGVQCEPAGSTSFSPKVAPDTELTFDGGMRILSVTEGGAADESGIEEGDVLLKFAGDEINSLNDLYVVIGETKDNEADLVLIRDGEFLSLQITPQERPEESNDYKESPKTVGLWTIEEAYNNELNGKQLPEGYILNVELVRGKDIMFEVNKDGDTWRANEAAIGQLPTPVQSIAEAIAKNCEPMVETKHKLTWNHQPAAQRNWIQRLSVLPTGQASWRFALTPDTNDNGASDRFEEIQKQLTALTEAVQELKNELDD